MDGERIIIITAKLGSVLLKRARIVPHKPTVTTRHPFIRLLLALDRTKPEFGLILFIHLIINSMKQIQPLQATEFT